MSQKKRARCDAKKLERLRISTGLTPKQFAESLGHSASWYAHCTRYEQVITLSDIAFIKAVYGVDVELKEAPAEVKEESKTDYTEVVARVLAIEKKMDELISAMNKLGNIEMQVLESINRLRRPSAYLSQNKEN